MSKNKVEKKCFSNPKGLNNLTNGLRDYVSEKGNSTIENLKAIGLDEDVAFSIAEQLLEEESFWEIENEKNS